MGGKTRNPQTKTMLDLIKKKGFGKNNRKQVMDIGEGVAGQVAELRVVHQVLHQRLSEKVSGTSPQSLAFVGSVFAPSRPVAGKSAPFSRNLLFPSIFNLLNIGGST